MANFVDLNGKSLSLLANESEDSYEWFLANGEPALSEELSDKPREQVEVLLHFVLWAYKVGLYEKGVRFALKAAQFARETGLLSLLRRALSLLAVMYSRVGNLGEAVVCYIEALEIAERIGDRTGEAATVVNLGELRLNAGLISESIALNQYALYLIKGDPQCFQVSRAAHHNVAAAALLLGDIEVAMREIREAQALAGYPTNDFFLHQSVVADTTECKIFVAASKLPEARMAAVRAVKRASQTSSRSAFINASLASALCDAAEGKAKDALDVLESIREKVRLDEPLYKDFLEIEARCNRHAGRVTYADHLSKTYLAQLATFQRRSVIRQVAAIQRRIRAGLPTAPRITDCLTEQHLAHTSTAEAVGSLAALSDQREARGPSHTQEVRKLTQAFALALGCSNAESIRFGQAAKIHHIGMLAIPDVLLLKRTQLTQVEREIVRRHTIEGCQILMDIMATLEQSGQELPTMELLRTAGEMSLGHHEWWDGSGYPRGTSGTEIAISAQVVGIVDAFEELVHGKTPKSINEALQLMRNLAGTQFNPEALKIFECLVRNLRFEHGQNLEAFAPEQNDASVYDRAYRVIERITQSIKQPYATVES
jgi:HD-GYP domain-containing protein (c-di-GMP phosphodiesterase class II)